MGMQVLPGIATATEAFSAIRAGATQLKLFPAVTYGPRHLQALRAVLPAGVRVFPVGGVGAAEIPAWLSAGAAGFGFGSELFRPEYDLPEIERRARQLVQALRTARQL
jgi:2-dehydro-3-deoxyphosphogalactonate aldolase